MSNKPRAFTKKYGSRKEVFDGVASMTRGGLSLDNLFLDDDGVIRSVKQQESLKKTKDNLVRKERKAPVKNEPSDSDNSEADHSEVGEDVTADENTKKVNLEQNRPKTKAVPTKALNISDIKEAVSAALQKNNSKLPKGHSTFKKQQWIDLARELNVVN